MELITLAHGAGGTETNRLIETVFTPAFQNPSLTADDAALLAVKSGCIAFTTDGFVVSPPFFSGGNIGKLSVCGTVNDLACMGAKPLYLSCSFIIEEGFEVEKLRVIAESMAETAREAGIEIAAGDTKVVARGQCDGVYITTSGVGSVLRENTPGGARAKAGDAVLVTGDIGRHGAAILIARGLYGIEADIESDCAPLWGMIENLFNAAGDVHCVRDATRGGLATVLCEIARQSGVSIEIDAGSLPVCGQVKGLCGMLGLEPLYLACEGRMAVILPMESAQAALEALHRSKYGKGAAIIGRVCDGRAGSVVMNTEIGGKRLLSPPSGELLPRIC